MTVKVTFEAANITALHAAIAAFFGNDVPANPAATPLAMEAYAAAEPKRGRGRPPGSGKKAEPESESAPAPAPEAPVEDAAAKVAARVAAVSAEALANEKPAKPAPSGAVQLSKQMLQEALIEVVKKHGRDACGALCRKHGGPNLSALSVDVYPALYADARELLAKAAE